MRKNFARKAGVIILKTPCQLKLPSCRIVFITIVSVKYNNLLTNQVSIVEEKYVKYDNSKIFVQLYKVLKF